MRGDSLTCLIVPLSVLLTGTTEGPEISVGEESVLDGLTGLGTLRFRSSPLCG